MKQLNYIIGLPLAKLINKSFQSGIFPDIFKIAKVVLIFKSESQVLCNNYIPISLLSNITKLTANVMQESLRPFRTTKLLL